MKIENKSKGAATVSEGLDSNAFGFKLDGQMYSMMMEKLYTNKPGAVIRELSCNALDSHVANGCPGKPFDIHMPTWLSKEFFIRDYGTGIPHDRFEHIYTNVGNSTKADTNGQIGAFGLGSKTPFTLSDTFSVENWNSGRKTTWVCFKDSGVPKVSKVYEDMHNTEPSGLKVSFSLTQDLEDEFKRSLVKELKYFPVKPNITGIPLPEWPSLPNDDGRGYEYSQDGTSSVLMGNINYAIPVYEITGGISNNSISVMNVLNKGIVIFANIGDIDITPSRESLELTEKTKTYIHILCVKIIKDYQTIFLKDISKCTHLLEAKSIARSSIAVLIRDMQGITLSSGKRFSIQELLSFTHDIPEYQPYVKYRGYGKSTYKKENKLRTDKLTDNNVKVFYDDLGRGGIKHLRDSDLGNHNVILREHNKVGKDKIKEELQACIKVMQDNHGIKVTALSGEIGYPEKKTRVTGTPKAPRTVTDQVYSVVPYGNEISTMKGPPISSLPTTGYYIPIHGLSVDSYAVPYITLIKTYRLLGYKEPLYLVRRKTVPSLKIPDISTLQVKLIGELQIRERKSKIFNLVLDKLRTVPLILHVKGHLLESACKETKLVCKIYTKLNKISPVGMSYNLIANYLALLGSSPTTNALPEKTVIKLDNLIEGHSKTGLHSLLNTINMIHASLNNKQALINSINQYTASK